MGVCVEVAVATREKILMSWSGGKDSSMALYEIQKSGKYEVAALITTLTEDYDRISMHGVRRTLLRRQAESLNMKLKEVYISKGATNEEYEVQMEEALKEYMYEGTHSVCFGDIFLADLRAYRERTLGAIGMKTLFPIWKRDTAELVQRFIELGFKAIVVCVDTTVLHESFCGKVIRNDFLSRLPSSVDPCGENGEFHSFVYDGPIFKQPIKFSAGEVAVRESRFCFCDLVPI